MKPYFEQDGITIYHGDCRDVLPTLPAVDLFFTSPPYNLGTTTGGGFGHYHAQARLGKQRGGGGKWTGGALSEGYGKHDDAMPHEEYVAWQKDILLLCWAQLSERGAIFYNHKPRVQGNVLITPFDYNPGLPVRQVVIWARAGGVNFSPSFYVPTHEWVVIFAKTDWRLRDKGASGVGDVWRIAQQVGDIDHPAPFPVELPARAIETTPPGLVCDPFMGSGSTLRAAKDLNRRAIGIEIEERYCEIAAKRLSQQTLGLGAA